MQGPAVEIVVLVLLIFYFGLQQRNRGRMRYRLWFVGWLLVGLAYVVWEFPVSPGMHEHVQDAVRFDLMLGGTIFFLMSFVTKSNKLWRVVGLGMLIGVPAVLVMDAMQFLPIPDSVQVVAVLAWQIYGVRAAYVLLPRGRVRTRLAVYTICAVYAVSMTVYIARGGDNLSDWALTEVLICTAILYGGGLTKRTPAVLAGVAGLLLWAGFYVAGDALPRGSKAVALLFVFWSLPKYFVGFSMILKVSEDASEEKEELADKFRELYEDYHVMFEGHPHPMWVHTEGDGQILSVNGAAVRNYGYSVEEFLKMKYQDLVVTSDAEAVVLETLYREGTEDFARHQFKNGETIWTYGSKSMVQFRGIDAVLEIARDVTDRVDANWARLHEAHHDGLTSLPNRTLLADRIQQSFKRCIRDGRKATLLTIDVDHFKRINDQYGHMVGDECLQVVAARLSSQIRQVDTIARVGGEEFAAIVGGVQTEADAGKVAESLLRVFDEPLRLGELELFVTISIGVAIYPDDADEAEDLKRRSDEALYAAKTAGRNRAVFASRMVSTGVALTKRSIVREILTMETGGDQRVQ